MQVALTEALHLWLERRQGLTLRQMQKGTIRCEGIVSLWLKDRCLFWNGKRAQASEGFRNSDALHHYGLSC